MFKVYVNYGYRDEEHVATYNTLKEARTYFGAYILDYIEEGETVEVISFANDGEAIVHETCTIEPYC
mgnify:CR=1 FL=1